MKPVPAHVLRIRTNVLKSRIKSRFIFIVYWVVGKAHSSVSFLPLVPLPLSSQPPNNTCPCDWQESSASLSFQKSAQGHLKGEYRWRQMWMTIQRPNVMQMDDSNGISDRRGDTAALPCHILSSILFPKCITNSSSTMTQTHTHHRIKDISYLVKLLGYKNIVCTQHNWKRAPEVKRLQGSMKRMHKVVRRYLSNKMWLQHVRHLLCQPAPILWLDTSEYGFPD